MSKTSRKGPEKEYIRARVPVEISSRVHVILTDPATGELSYGSMSTLITELLSRWLGNLGSDEEQRAFHVQKLTQLLIEGQDQAFENGALHETSLTNIAEYLYNKGVRVK